MIVDVAQPVIDVPLFLKLTVPVAPVAVAPPSLMVAERVTVSPYVGVLELAERVVDDGAAIGGLSLDATGEPYIDGVRPFPEVSACAVASVLLYRVFNRSVVPELIAPTPEPPAVCVAANGGLGEKKLVVYTAVPITYLILLT